MLTSYEKFRIFDGRKLNTFFAEINWDDKDKTTNNCQVIKFTFPNGDQAYVKKEYLLSMIFAMGTPEEQKKMIPQKITTVKHYETMLGITATKNIQKGEKINVAVKIPIPDQTQEVIGSLRAGDYILKK